jgi:hypothetical protein
VRYFLCALVVLFLVLAWGVYGIGVVVACGVGWLLWKAHA